MVTSGGDQGEGSGRVVSMWTNPVRQGSRGPFDSRGWLPREAANEWRQSTTKGLSDQGQVAPAGWKMKLGPGEGPS